MSKPVILVVAGVVLGVSLGLFSVGGDSGRKAFSAAFEGASMLARLAHGAFWRPVSAHKGLESAARPFTGCLRAGDAKFEKNLRNLLEFHDHESTLALTECLLGTEPTRFCEPEGVEQAGNVMEIYFWARDDARRTTPEHALADKIRILGRKAASEPTPPDLFQLNWSGPRDKALFDQLRELVRQGYLQPGGFALSPRAELREALSDVKPEGAACLGVARRG